MHIPFQQALTDKIRRIDCAKDVVIIQIDVYDVLCFRIGVLEICSHGFHAHAVQLF